MLSFVERWAICPRHHHQTVAEHHYFVTLYASQLCHMLSIKTADRILVLDYALRHDARDVWESDVPGPAKRSLFDGIKAAAYEAKFASGMDDLYRLSMSVSHDPVHSAGGAEYFINDIIKVADLIDEVFFLAYERNLGNELVKGLYQREMHRLDQAAVRLGGDRFSGQLMDVLGEQIARIAEEGAIIPVNDADIQTRSAVAVPQLEHSGKPDA